MMPESWLIADREDLHLAAAATVDRLSGWASRPLNTTQRYCLPRKHPTLNQWAFPLDTVTKSMRPQIEADLGISLEPFLVDYPGLLSGGLAGITRTIDGVGSVTIVKTLDATWEET